MLATSHFQHGVVFFPGLRYTYAALIKVTQTGSRRCAQLVESFRKEEGLLRQRTVCDLGRSLAGGEVDALIASLHLAQGTALAASALDELRFIDCRHAGDILLCIESGALLNLAP